MRRPRIKPEHRAYRTVGGGAGQDSGLYPKVSQTRGFVSGGDGSRPGDPAKAAAAVLAALQAEKTPLRLPLGDDAVTAVLGHLDQVRRTSSPGRRRSGRPPSTTDVRTSRARYGK